MILFTGKSAPRLTFTSTTYRRSAVSTSLAPFAAGYDYIVSECEFDIYSYFFIKYFIRFFYGKQKKYF